MKKGGTLALLFLFVGAGFTQIMEDDSACGIKNVDCIASDSGSAYTGTVSKTKAGVECQAWNDQSLHQHSFGTEMKHNHCRNPDGKSGVWCFTKDSDTTWDFCEVQECRNCETDLDVEDRDGEKDIVKLKGRCIAKKTEKSVLTGIKTKTECLNACLAKENATGCQYRRVKKRCKVVTGSFQKASQQLGVTCWRFNDVHRRPHAMQVQVFSNVTRDLDNVILEGSGSKCGGPNMYCPIDAPICCLNQYPSSGGCCFMTFPRCSEKYCWDNVISSPHPSFFFKHILYDVLGYTIDILVDFCTRRNAATPKNLAWKNHVFIPDSNAAQLPVPACMIPPVGSFFFRIIGDLWELTDKDLDGQWKGKQIENGADMVAEHRGSNGHFIGYTLTKEC